MTRFLFASVNHCVELILGLSFPRTVLTEKLEVVNGNVCPTAIASTIANFASATAIVECLALGDKKTNQLFVINISKFVIVWEF
jgi:hypothetical protein